MPTISIALPSIYERCAIRTLRNIRDATRSSVEVILVSPFPPPKDLRGAVVWIEEKEGTGTGCTGAHARAFERMTGEFVLPFADDHVLIDGWDVLALRRHREREKLSKARPFVLGLRHAQSPCVGTEFGIYYPYFPLCRREDAVRVGWFNPDYKRGFADSDFALRVWAAGGRCEWSDVPMLVVTADDARKNGPVFATEDMVTFIRRWAPIYGGGWKIDGLRSFNIDVIPERLPQAMLGAFTIYHNRPDFAAAGRASTGAPG